MDLRSEKTSCMYLDLWENQSQAFSILTSVSECRYRVKSKYIWRWRKMKVVFLLDVFFRCVSRQLKEIPKTKKQVIKFNERRVEIQPCILTCWIYLPPTGMFAQKGKWTKHFGDEKKKYVYLSFNCLAMFSFFIRLCTRWFLQFDNYIATVFFYL